MLITEQQKKGHVSSSYSKWRRFPGKTASLSKREKRELMPLLIFATRKHCHNIGLQLIEIIYFGVIEMNIWNNLNYILYI